MSMPPLVTFAAGGSGPWRIGRMERVRGEALPGAARLSVREGADAVSGRAAFRSSRAQPP